MKKPLRVERCTTHHDACDCREWQRERMETALKIICTWASCDHLSNETRSKAMQSIVEKCKEVLSTSEPSPAKPQS